MAQGVAAYSPPLAQQHAKHDKQGPAVLRGGQLLAQQGDAEKQGKNRYEIGVGGGAASRKALNAKIVQAVSCKGYNAAQIENAGLGNPCGKIPAKADERVKFRHHKRQQTKKDHAHKGLNSRDAQGAVYG